MYATAGGVGVHGQPCFFAGALPCDQADLDVFSLSRSQMSANSGAGSGEVAFRDQAEENTHTAKLLRSGSFLASRRCLSERTAPRQHKTNDRELHVDSARLSDTTWTVCIALVLYVCM
jgi:hypothetical protein